MPNTNRHHLIENPTTVEADLRAWAAGMHTTTAAVELLIRAFGGRFARPGKPWIQPDEQTGRYWLDAAAIEGNLEALSGGERRLLRVVASLADGEQQRGHLVTGVVDLSDIASGLSRDNLSLVLAAIAHAGGSHEHSDIAINPESHTYSMTKLGSLYPWPENSTEATS